MNFKDEPYVRVYKRRTTTMAIVGWQARAVLRELFLVVDRAGVLDLDDEEPATAIAAVLGDVPVEVIRDAIGRLAKKGIIQINGRCLVIPRYREAQESPSSDLLRARESRERRRLDALGQVDSTGYQQASCPQSQIETDDCVKIAYPKNTDETGDCVTFRDDLSRSVTPCHAVSPSTVQYSTVQCSTVLDHVVEPPPSSAIQPTQQQARKPKRTPEIPVAMPTDWAPSDPLVLALAEKCQTTPERIRACVPEFRVYWTEGHGSGTRRGPRGWATTFAKRIQAMAERGGLYVGPDIARRSQNDARRQPRPNDDAVIRPPSLEGGKVLSSDGAFAYHPLPKRKTNDDDRGAA